MKAQDEEKAAAQATQDPVTVEAVHPASAKQQKTASKPKKGTVPKPAEEVVGAPPASADLCQYVPV